MNPYYQDDLVTIYHGDALDVMLDVTAQVIVTDPPYYLPAQHSATRQFFARSLSGLALLEHFYRDWWTEVHRVLAPAGALYSFCDGQSYPVLYALGYGYAKSIRPLVWDKTVSVNGYGWRHQHELILYAEWPEAEPIKTGDGDVLRYRATPTTNRTHPAEKPLALMARLVAKHPGIVLDPFMGSGSTLVAARQLGRKAIGIEIEERYCEIAARRCSQEVLGLPA